MLRKHPYVHTMALELAFPPFSPSLYLCLLPSFLPFLPYMQFTCTHTYTFTHTHMVYLNN